MAIYRLSAQVISRSTGRAATAASAYRAGARIEDRRTGQVHDYARRRGVVHEEILTPARTPDWMRDRNALWNAVEAAEKRKDAQLCREVQLALPHELSASERLSLVRAFVSRTFVRHGMIADVAIHAPHRQGDSRNHHAHVLLTLRDITADGFGKKNRTWNDRTALQHWRQAWARDVNRALERAGQEQRVDHRTLQAQRAAVVHEIERARAANDNRTAEILDLEAARLDRDPQPKIGHIATALERRGEPTERGDIWRQVVARNLERFGQWLTLQRMRLDALRERLERAMSRAREREAERRVGAPETAGAFRKPDRQGDPSGYTQEQRDRLLGRRRDGAVRPDRDRLSRWRLGRTGRDPGDDRER